MASSGAHYPDHLNPFDEEEDEDEASKSRQAAGDDYPEHLDPFGDEEAVPDNNMTAPSVDDYDDSLNPFGDEITSLASSNDQTTSKQSVLKVITEDGDNPFTEAVELKQQDADEGLKAELNESMPDTSITLSSESLEPPPIPLPRTKSLLKKEQAHRRRLQHDEANDHQHPQIITSSSTSSSNTTVTQTTGVHQPPSTKGSFQRRKNKRLAPPVPVNFKRQVSGSLGEIEEELNEIGDKLAIIDRESIICQATLTTPSEHEESELKTTRSKFIELIKRRNSIVRRQKELMYKKRELILDQLHSDIEYELRMIGNKQVSTRSQEDDAKEKELLKKLVEIVEEKNDIVENLNKDSSCDKHDIEEAFKRLNITEHFPAKSDDRTVDNGIKIVSKGEGCDRRSLSKLSKIATLLPRANTIKIKRKRLFKKNCDSRPIER